MPPDAGAGAVLGDEHVLKRRRLHAGEGGGRPPEREEEVGDVIRLSELAAREVVVPAEGDHAAPARVAVELELPEGQPAHERQEPGLLFGADQLGTVAEAFGETRPCLAC